MSGDDKTIIRPRPGRKSQGSPAGNDNTIVKPKPRPGASSGDETAIKPKSSSRKAPVAPKGGGLTSSPLMDAASPVLSLVNQMRQLDGKVNVPSIHQQVTKVLQEFIQKIKGTVNDSEIRHNASYILCSLVDETALNTQWGEYSAWSQKPQLSIFHKETYGGEKVYAMLEEAIVSPSRNYELIELIYYCLSLGFMGKLRIDPQGPVKLEQTRSNIYDVLHRSREKHQKVLSEHLDPAVSTSNKLYSFLPIWIFMGLLVLAGFSIFNYWLIQLNERSDVAFSTVDAVIPREEKVDIKDYEEKCGYARELQTSLLATEIGRGVVSVECFARYTSITLHSEELFPPASTEIDQRFQPILTKIARALEKVEGRIDVLGHTDNQPIRSIQFASNWELSLARANAVVNYMAKNANLSSRLLPEGKGDLEPIADNSTIEGRAKNRRVEINIYHDR